MVRKKSKKTSKKSSRKSNTKKSQTKRATAKTKVRKFTPLQLIIYAVFTAVFIYGGYLIWTEDYIQGLALIALLLFVTFLIKFFLKMEKLKK